MWQENGCNYVVKSLDNEHAYGFLWNQPAAARGINCQKA